MPLFPSVTTGGAFESPEVRAEIKKLAPTPDLSAYATKAELKAQSGVRAVSGTVTLTTADGPLVQVYATSSATVQGEPLSTGEIAIFRFIGGKWEVRVMNADGSVRDATWRAPGAPDLRTPVTAPPPAWTDDEASGGGSWSTPTITGVTYSPASGTATPGQSVTVTATAKPGYRLDGTSSWTHAFPVDPNAITFTKTTLLDTFNRPNGALGDAAMDSGQIWEGSYLMASISSGTLQPAAGGGIIAAPHNAGASPIQLSFDFIAPASAACDVAIALRATGSTKDGVGIQVKRESGRDIVQFIESGAISGAAVTFNNNNGSLTSNPWAYLPGSEGGAAYAAAKTYAIAVTMTEAKMTVYCDGARILEKTSSIPAAKTHTQVYGAKLSVGTVDNLKVMTP